MTALLEWAICWRPCSQTSELFWLCRAFTHQVARVVESHSPSLDWSPNPVNSDRAWGGRTDPELSSHLCMGLGGEDQADPATFINPHVASFLTLRKKHKRWGKRKRVRISTASGVGQILSQYMAASQAFFAPESCRSVSVAADGSRVGGLEILLVVLIGTSVTGFTKVCWAPPQVCLWLDSGDTPPESHQIFTPYFEGFQNGESPYFHT